jgi:hypothetical protein
MNDLSGLYKNPKVGVVKKYMAEILKGRYPNNAEFIERIASLLVTDQDVSNFGTLIGNVFQTGYEKSVADHRAELAKHGITTTVKPEESNR